MRVLLVGPLAPENPDDRTGGGGSLPPHLDVLATGLRGHSAHVRRVGLSTPPYDPHRGEIWSTARILATAHDLLDQVLAILGSDPHGILAVHYGNIEVEQLVPALRADRVKPAPAGTAHPPVVHHAHTLAPTLLRVHRPEPALQAAIDAALDHTDGLLCFGGYAHRLLAPRLLPGTPTTVSPLPTTIPPGTRPVPGPDLAIALAAPGRGPLVTLFGYATPWKDAAGLLDALALLRAPLRLVLAGLFWDDPSQAGASLPAPGTTEAVGKATVSVVPGYLDPGQRAALTAATDLAVFPYRNDPAFQGSGAITDYLAAGVPVVATDVANMAELIGDGDDSAGDVVPPGDPAALARALDRYSDHSHQAKRRAGAHRRAHRFSAAGHARDCLDLYQRVLTRRARGTA